MELTNQDEFVGWWGGNVRGKGNSNSADLRYFVEDAERISGITHQQVSRWLNRLKERAVSRDTGGSRERDTDR